MGSAATANRLKDAKEAWKRHKATAGRLPPPIPLIPPAWHEAGLRSLAVYRLGAAWWRGTLGRGARALPVVMD